jgi:hypothetical protein
MLVQRWRPLRRRGNNYITSTSSAVCTFCLAGRDSFINMQC